MKRFVLAAALASLSISFPASAEAQLRTAPRPADLAATVAGTYHGDVISDARGSSRSGVMITVTRIGPNLVEVSSDYARIPTVRIPLTRAMSAILSNSPRYVFLIDTQRDPNQLSLTIDDASLSVTRHH